MITGEVRNKIDGIWETLWAGGITNPLTVIEQLTYLMFIRSLDEVEMETEEMAILSKSVHRPLIFPESDVGQSMRWNRLIDMEARQMFDIISTRVFPAIKNMRGGQLPDFDQSGNMVPRGNVDEGTSMAFARYMRDATFLIPTPQVLEKVVTGLNNLMTNIKDIDMQGDLYEYMLGKLQTAGQNGQFRTPKHIRQMMVELMAPTPDDTICDPACGTAGFLISAYEYIRSRYEGGISQKQWEHLDSDAFTGFDTDNTMLRISAMNMMLHSVHNPNIQYCDSISKNNTCEEKFTVCLANPPFKGTVNQEIIDDSLRSVVSTTKTELLFVALFLRILRKGGRCACIVPDGVLFGSSKAHKALRRELIENNQLRAVISMPSGVFKPYAGVSTAVLVFTKTGYGGTDNVWFYDMKADGFSLDDKRSPISNNDIPDIVRRFHDMESESERERTEQSFLVPKAEIVSNDYDLSINKYKKVVYVEEKYPPSSEIVAELKKLNQELTEDIRILEDMLR